MNLSGLVAASAKSMRADLAELRAAATHAGLKGTAAEEMLAKFLRERLPTSLGVTAGQVVDRDGAISKQVDVVIYDATRTPALFTSPNGSWDVVPAEGVLAVIEVKMHLSAGDLPGVLANCASVLELRRDAYIGEPAEGRMLGHGRTYSELPICYHLFAFESDSMYAQKLNAAQQHLDLAQRVTAVCYLDRGINLHVAFDGATPTYQTLAHPPGLMVDIATESALLAWFAALSHIVLQTQLRPISLIQYAEEALSDLSGTLGPESEELRTAQFKAMRDHIFGQLGVPAAVAEKITAGVPLDPEEVAIVEAAGGTVGVDANGRPAVTLPSPPLR